MAGESIIGEAVNTPVATVGEGASATPVNPLDTTGSNQSTEAAAAAEAAAKATAEAAAKTDGSDKNGKDGDADAPKNEAPVKYEPFKVPDGITLDEAKLGKFTEIALANKLTQEQAQSMVDLHSEVVASVAAQQIQQWETTKETWAKETKADKEIGGAALDKSIADANFALEKLGTPELGALLTDFGVGNHKEVVRFVAKVGALLREDKFHGNGSSNPTVEKKPLANRLFPNQV